MPLKIAYRKQKPLNHVFICFDGNVHINVEQMKTAADLMVGGCVVVSRKPPARPVVMIWRGHMLGR